jgi:ABC-type amino acid transport substrate-binding protein
MLFTRTLWRHSRRSATTALTSLTIFTTLLVGSATPSIASDTLTKILSEKKLSVGYIPYDDLTKRDLKSGKIVGFFPDVIEAIAAEAGIKPENITYVATDWANFAVGLQGKKYDISIAGTFKTIPRVTAAAFTRPIFHLGNSAVARKGDTRFANVTNIMDLDQAGLTVSVISGEQSYDFARANFTKAKLTVIKSPNLANSLLEVTAKRADVALSDHYVVRSFVARNPDTVDLFAKSPWNVQPIAWAVRTEDQQLLNFLNASIDYLESAGKLREIMRKKEYADVPFLVVPTKLELVK